MLEAADGEDAMVAVRDIKEQAETLNKNSCGGIIMFCCMSWCFGVCYVLGRFPEFVVLVYVASFLVFVPLDCYCLKKVHQQGAFREFCWFANIAGISMFVVIVILMVQHIHSSGSEHRRLFERYFFVMAWAPATSVLVVMAVANGNAAAFDNLPTFGETFIHLAPTFVMFSLRWRTESYKRYYPQIYTDLEDIFAGVTPWTIFYGQALLYTPWWICYTIWAISCGIRSAPDNTFFHQQMQRVREWRTLARCRAWYSEADHPVCGDVILYMLGHAAFILALSLVSVFAFKVEYFHAGVNCVATASVILFGARRYSYMISYYTAVKNRLH